jgi:predicted HTH transcriptional regulator
LIELPTTIAEVQTLIDTQVQESLHLDYKDSRALARVKASEISKDVSAFANADGGTIIYGVTEVNHVRIYPTINRGSQIGIVAMARNAAKQAARHSHRTTNRRYCF